MSDWHRVIYGNRVYSVNLDLFREKGMKVIQLAVRKPGAPIKVIEFTEFVTPPSVIYRDDRTAYVINKLHNSQINVEHGDYVRVDDENDTYPIKRSYFEENFQLVDGK